MDPFNTSGPGENVPINTGNQSEGLRVFKDGTRVVLRVSCLKLHHGRPGGSVPRTICAQALVVWESPGPAGDGGVRQGDSRGGIGGWC